MGSLKGPVIHDTLYKILKEKKADVEFRYGFDDFDPIDGLSDDLRITHEKYMGVPIFLAPSPDGNGSFGDYYGRMMQSLLDELDIHPDPLYRTSELYKKGVFNNAIKIVLDNVLSVRQVYEEMYKKKLSETWYPFQVICPSCGKLGTTKVVGWDGKEAEFECSENLVVWAKGCGEKGKISPFDGNGKMVWKVEWAAKWFTFGVTIEGAGKDHASAGGSYDIAMELAEKVFKVKRPLKLAYEFFLSGGKKMSSSKGLGLTGRDLMEVVGPQRSRFLMIKTPPNQAVEFAPKGTETIPTLFDSYQASTKSEETDQKRVFELSQSGLMEKITDKRFATIAQWVQMPNMEEEIKKEGLEDWAKYAMVRVEKFAPEADKFFIQKQLPVQVQNLSKEQKEFLKKLAGELDKNWIGEDLQTRIYDLGKELDLNGKQSFAAIYLSLIGKDHGPKAGWLILSLDRDFVKKRFNEASK
jgi:lysyl-tRNA synthetase class 1